MSFQDIQGGPHPQYRRNQSPAQAVAAGIFQINTSVATFRRLVDAVGTVKDTPEHRQKLYLPVTSFPIQFFCFFVFLCFHYGVFGRHNTRQRILQQVKDTSAKLKSLSESDRGANSNVGFSFLVIIFVFSSFFFYLMLQMCDFEFCLPTIDHTLVMLPGFSNHFSPFIALLFFYA